MKVTISKMDRFWKEVRSYKRSQYNRFFNRSVFRAEEIQEFVSPSEITLDRCIRFIERGVGGDVSIVFSEDVSRAEIKKILEILEAIL